MSSWVRFDTHYELAVCGALIKDGNIEKICVNGVPHAYAGTNVKNVCGKHSDKEVCTYSESVVKTMATSGGGVYKSPLSLRDGSWFITADKCRFCESKVVYQQIYCTEHMKTGLKRSEIAQPEEIPPPAVIVTAEDEDDSYPIRKRSKMSGITVDDVQVVVRDELKYVEQDVCTMRFQLAYLTNEVARVLRHVDYIREDIQVKGHITVIKPNPADRKY